MTGLFNLDKKSNITEESEEPFENLITNINNLMNKKLGIGKVLIPTWNESQRLTYLV
jgi:hypothetical protein